MTRKEQLLAFIEANIDDTKMLKTIERRIETFTAGQRRISASKEILIDIITSHFNDDLEGQIPNDSHTIKILEWTAVYYDENAVLP